jgi:hypothetical protein
MKRLLTMALVSAMVFSASNKAIASDEDDIKAAIKAMFEVNAGTDIEGWIGWHTADANMFNGGPVGAMLVTPDWNATRVAVAAQPPPAADAPAPQPIQVQHIEVNMLGDDVAYTTGYLLFPAAPGSGNPPGRMRSTMIWVKQGGKWKRKHYHTSPLYPNTSQ